MRDDLTAAVGNGQPNRRLDVRTVQSLLNQAAGPSASGLLKIDGLYGPLTHDALYRFQASAVHMTTPDGVVDVGGPTLRALGGPRPAPALSRPASVAAPQSAAGASSIAPHSEAHRVLKRAAHAHPSLKVQNWIVRVLPYARACKLKWRVPIAVTISQGALESGWGLTPTAQNNFFGIKGKSEMGGTKSATHEEIDGHRVYEKDSFRNYDSLVSSVDDFGHFLNANHRYASAFVHTNDAEEFFLTIARAGYATDHKYQQLVLKVMRSHGIEDYDHENEH